MKNEAMVLHEAKEIVNHYFESSFEADDSIIDLQADPIINIPKLIKTKEMDFVEYHHLVENIFRDHPSLGKTQTEQIVNVVLNYVDLSIELLKKAGMQEISDDIKTEVVEIGDKILRTFFGLYKEALSPGVFQGKIYGYINIASVMIRRILIKNKISLTIKDTSREDFKNLTKQITEALSFLYQQHHIT